jgi:hypothetical protein
MPCRFLGSPKVARLALVESRANRPIRPESRQRLPKTTRQSGRSLETRNAFDVAILSCIRSDCSGKNIRVPMAMR